MVRIELHTPSKTYEKCILTEVNAVPCVIMESSEKASDKFIDWMFKMKLWLHQMFKARQVLLGGVVRRKIQSVEQYASMDELLCEVKNRNFHALTIGEQVIVICDNASEINVLC